MKLIIKKRMYKTMSRVNIKQTKPKVKTIVKVIEKDSPSLLEEIENLKRELEINNEILDNTFKISHEQEDRIKQLSKRVIESEKLQIEKKTDEIEDIINKSEIMLKNIKRDSQSNIKKPVVKHTTRKLPIAIKKQTEPNGLKE